MARKSGVSIGIVIMCMAAIILLGRWQLSPNNSEGEDTQVQGMHLETNQQTEENQEIEESITLIDRDVFHELLNGQAVSEETYAKRTAESGEKSGVAVEEEEDSALTQEEILKVREEEAVQAMQISNPKMDISAKAAILMDTSNKEILYHKNALDEIQPASTAKLLTAIVAVEMSEDKDTYVVGSEIGLIAADSSRAYLCQGQELSLSQILDALLLPSGNDAAYVIAANIGRKIAGDDSLKAKAAVKLFLEAMNQKADEIGVVHSNFASPDGYDAKGQYTTAYDMALIGCEALKYEEIRETVKKEKARDILISGDDVTWYNSNKLVKQGSGYYYSYAIGLKTGSSGKAGRCLISAAKKGDTEYVSAVMDASYDGRWQDSVDLLRYAVSQE